MSALADYRADVARRGGYYFEAMPANAPVSPAAIGRPGARFPAYSATRSYTYESAPAGAQLEGAAGSFLENLTNTLTVYAAENPLGIPSWDDDLKLANWQSVKDSFNKGRAAVPGAPSLLDLLASVLGVPKIFLVALLVFIAWSMLQSAGLVPSFRKVIK